MTTRFCIYLLCCLTHLSAAAEVFDNADGKVQEYVVKQLSLAFRNCDIAIVQDRWDDGFRVDSGLKPGQIRSLDLRKMRLLRILKGLPLAKYNEVIYLYTPFDKEWFIMSEVRSGRPHRAEPPYRPLFLSDDLMRLVLMRRQIEPLKERILKSDRDPRLKPFLEDASELVSGKMTAANFMSKYDLTDNFSNKVYSVIEGCVFQVDYPAPVMEETELMRMNKQNLQLTKARVTDSKKMTRLIHLTPREASEIIFIAYQLEGKKGFDQYAAVAKGDPLLEPMEPAEFKTTIGKQLFEVMKPEIEAVRKR